MSKVHQVKVITFKEQGKVPRVSSKILLVSVRTPKMTTSKKGVNANYIHLLKLKAEGDRLSPVSCAFISQTNSIMRVLYGLYMLGPTEER